MRRGHLHRFAAHKGFTLIESIIVMVVLGIAAVAIINLQGNIFFGQSANKNMQIGVQLMQECAEQVLATRRGSRGGYTAVASPRFGTNACGGMTAFSSDSIPSVTLTPYTGAGCPTGGTCKLVSITQGGLSPITLMLVNY